MEQFETFQAFCLQNLALTVFDVPHSLDSGPAPPDECMMKTWPTFTGIALAGLHDAFPKCLSVQGRGIMEIEDDDMDGVYNARGTLPLNPYP